MSGGAERDLPANPGPSIAIACESAPLCPTPEPWRHDNQSGEHAETHEGEDRDGSFGRPRRQDQLKEGNRVTPPLLQRSDRAVSSPDQERAAFDPEEGDRRPEQRGPATTHDTPADVGERAELQD